MPDESDGFRKESLRDEKERRRERAIATETPVCRGTSSPIRIKLATGHLYHMKRGLDTQPPYGTSPIAVGKSVWTINAPPPIDTSVDTFSSSVAFGEQVKTGASSSKTTIEQKGLLDGIFNRYIALQFLRRQISGSQGFREKNGMSG
jgi:hypothetical protein